MRSLTAVACGAVVGAAMGVGGTLLVQSVTEKAPDRLSRASIEKVTALALGPKVREVSCALVRGPFYTCTAYTSLDAGGDYDVVVDRNWLCLHARASGILYGVEVNLDGDDSGSITARATP